MNHSLYRKFSNIACHGLEFIESTNLKKDHESYEFS